MSLDQISLDSWITNRGGAAVLGLLASLLLIGQVVHNIAAKRGLFLGFLIFPPVVLSGLLGLLFMSILSSIDYHTFLDLENGFSVLKVNLTEFVFASLVLGLQSSFGRSLHGWRGLLSSVLHEGMPMVIYSQILLWGQSGSCLFVAQLIHLFSRSSPASSSSSFLEQSLSVVVAQGVEAGDCSNSFLATHKQHLARGLPLSDARVSLGEAREWTEVVLRESESLGLLCACACAVLLMSARALLTSCGLIQQETSLPSRTCRPVANLSVGQEESFNRGGEDNLPMGRDYAHETHEKNDDTSKFSDAYDFRSNSEKRSEVDDTQNGMYGKEEFKISPNGQMRHSSGISSQLIASLGTHVSLIALAVFLSFGFSVTLRVIENNFVWTRYLLSGLPVFKLSMLMALVLMQTILHFAPTLKFKREWFMRLCGLMLDLLVVCSLSSSCLKTHKLEKTHYLWCSVYVLVCLGWNLFCFFFIAKEIFPNYWFTRAVTLSGDCIGHSFMGLLLARTLDPFLLSPVPVAYAYKLMIVVIPSSAIKNSILLQLVESRGISFALLICILIVASWYFIFDSYFRHRFVGSTNKKSEDIVKNDDSDKVVNNNNFNNNKNDNDSSPKDEEQLLRSRSQKLNEKTNSQTSTSAKKILPFHHDELTGLELEEDCEDEEEICEHDIEENKQKSNNLTSPTVKSPNLKPQASGGSFVYGVLAQASESSSILTTEQMQSCASLLPRTQQGRVWNLRYSLRRDGASLNTLLALCQRNSDYRGRSSHFSSVLVVEDSWGYIFGGFISHGIEAKNTYYGSGEDFVFSLVPTVEKHSWTEENNFFVLSNQTTLAMGGGGDGFSIQLDDELDTGVSNRSATFNNKQLSSSEFFKCLNLEVWSIEGMIV